MSSKIKFANIEWFAKCIAAASPEEKQKVQLQNIVQGKKVLDFANLSAVDRSLVEIKEEIIQILKFLDITALEISIPIDMVPARFADVFKLARIYQKIARAAENTIVLESALRWQKAIL